MLVRFISSETGELMMFAEVARTLLQAVGKETGRRGAFTRDEMADAAGRLRAAVAHGESPPAAPRQAPGPGRRRSARSRSGPRPPAAPWEA